MGASIGNDQRQKFTTGCAGSRHGRGRTQRFAGRAATSGAKWCLKKEERACRVARTRRRRELSSSEKMNSLFGAGTQPFCVFGPSNWRDASKFQRLNLRTAPA